VGVRGFFEAGDGMEWVRSGHVVKEPLAGLLLGKMDVA
jgi:hypothetical protein